jgi:pilus assembly protein CpaB
MKAARVVVLTVALAAGGVAALLAGRSDRTPAPKAEAPKSDTVDILVAKSDLPRGQALSSADVSWQPWPATTAAGNFIRKSDRPKALENLTGMIVRAPFVAGEPIREAKLVNAKGSGFMAAILPSGMRAVATQITPESGVGGFILPNDRVDVIMTPRNRDDKGGERTSETILRNIRVLAIDQTVEEKTARRSSSARQRRSSLRPVRRKLWRCHTRSAFCRCRCEALPTGLSKKRRTIRRVKTSTLSGSA